MQKNILLLSIRREHADKIFDGTKTVELRRVRPRLEQGDLVLVYVPTPVKALVGAFEVDRVVESTPQALWNKVEQGAGLSDEQYEEYFYGVSIGYGIFLKKSWRLPVPLELAHLRSLWSNFHPPQGYQYMGLNDLNLVGLD